MTIRLPFSLKNSHFSGIAAFFFGLVAHFFTLTNVIQNLDNIATPIGIGAGVASGRWFLELMDMIAKKFLVGTYNLHWFNGFLYLLVLAAVAYFLTEVLELRSRLFSVLTGMAVVSFPAVAEIIIFRFTCIHYAIALLFSVLAVWVVKRWKFGWLLSVVLSACSMGIYQAFLPMTVSLFVVVLLRQTLEGKETVSRLFLRGVACCVSILASLGLYLLMVKVTSALYSGEIDGYQVAEVAGGLSLRELPGMVVRAFLTFFTDPRDVYRIIHTTFMELLYLGLGAAALLGMGYLLLVRIRKVGHILFGAFLCLVFPVAVNLVTIMSSSDPASTMMMYPYVLVMLLPLLVLDVLLPEEKLPGLVWKAGKQGVCLLLALLIFCNTYYANLNYQIQYYYTQQAENYMNGLIVQARMTEGYTPEKKWAFLGYISDPLLDSYWMELGDHLGYSRTFPVTWTLQFYSWESWINTYVGYTVPKADGAEMEALRQLEEVKAMPEWPSQGSMQVIGEYLVIKLG